MRNKRGRIGLLIVTAIVGLEAYLFSTMPYYSDNERLGLAVFSCIFIVFMGLAWVLSLPVRKATYRAASIIAIGGIGVLLTDYQPIATALGPMTTKSISCQFNSPAGLTTAAQEHAHRVLLNILAAATKAARDADAAQRASWALVEPAFLQKALRPATATKEELERYSVGFETAELNVAALEPRFHAILQQERERDRAAAERLHLSSNVVGDLTKCVAERQAVEEARFTLSREIYHAQHTQLSILAREFGAYEVAANGQIVFRNSAAMEQYNAAHKAATEATADAIIADLERLRSLGFRVQLGVSLPREVKELK